MTRLSMAGRCLVAHCDLSYPDRLGTADIWCFGRYQLYHHCNDGPSALLMPELTRFCPLKNLHLSIARSQIYEKRY